MNDPWDVKSVKQSGQYTSCMKINGVPLLPPVLSKECRKEMQYYKLLAKEIEKRIKFLKPYLVETDTDGSDKTDAPELPDYEQICELPLDNTQPPYIEDVDKITAVITENTTGKSEVDSQTSTLASNVYNNITSNVLLMSPAETPISTVAPKLVIDVNLKISDNVRIEPETIVEGPPYSPMSNELPERDFSSIRILPEKELLTETETVEKVDNKKEREILGDLLDYSIKINKDILNKSDPFPELLTQDGPPSLTSKSFTGSLIDIPTEAVKESHKAPKLIRQRSYTILHPSPQLLAHLEEQYLNSGVEITSISMSESLSNLNSTNKKRRSWDLESAKVKWSSMAIELNQKTASSVKQNINKGQHFTTKVTLKKVSQPQVSPPNKSKSLTQEKPRHASLAAKPLPKSEPIQKAKKTLSPVRNVPSNRTIVKEPAATGAYHKENSPSQKSNTTSPNQCSHLISESFDPATRVRELYEKIQNQQLLQMANLVEKQKKEQMLLQQVFEEQNNLLYKQLKTICPKSPGGLKEAWVDKEQGAANRGPVRLSQLINHKTAENSPYDSTISSTLTDTNNYINQCDNTLKKSRDISGSIKKKTPTRSQNGSKVQSSSSRPETRTTTHSPYQRNSISRKLQYDTSGSTERDLEPILTDRTNDTMADLNVTFPSDYEDEYYPLNNNNNTVINHNSKNSTLVHEPARTRHSSQRNSTDSAIRSMEETIYKSMNNMYLRKPKPRMFNCEPTPQERAAATKIVAYAKGYLVRRLMRTEQVQATVQTIKDALLCALQLHQDREGIKGADVDLHRRLIQQITAACYALHDTFVASTPSERCATIAADRARRRRRTNSLTSSQTQSYTNRVRDRDIMSQSHSGVFPARVKRTPASSLMTQSNYETFSGSKWGAMGPRRRPWR